MSGDGAIRHATPHPPVERSDKCGGCRLQHELDQLRQAVAAADERRVAACAELINAAHAYAVAAERARLRAAVEALPGMGGYIFENVLTRAAVLALLDAP